MSYILGTKLVSNRGVRIALTEIFGIGPKKALQICSRVGLGDNIEVHQLTKYQIYRINKISSQISLVDSELLRREIRIYIKRLITISCYRGFRHKAGLPLRGQRTHTNARTCRRSREVFINRRKKSNDSLGKYIRRGKRNANR
jgi:small subunit ribosomal protein S13